jgi:nucleoside-diphosphate-sugar epimerase
MRRIRDEIWAGKLWKSRRYRALFVISQSIHRILNGRQPLLYDLGDQTRCFTYVDDAIVGFLLASQSSAAIR